MRLPLAAIILTGSVLAAETFPDGSTGQVTTFPAADKSRVPAYLRMPQGLGSFPVVVLLHGGAPSPETTYLLGRTMNPPTADFVAAGWAVMLIDYHPNPTQPTSDRADALAAIAYTRKLPHIDSDRVALYGGSHGGSVISRLASHVDVRAGIMCAPAVLDLYEISKVIDQGVEVASILKKMVADAPKRYGAPLSQVIRDPPKYNYESALLEAAQVRIPVMIINGRNDTSAPIAVTQAYVDKLRAAGKEVATFFPDDGLHGFYFGFLDNRGSGKPPNVTAATREAARQAVAFLREHFK
jgi:dipeptidyl aminopeptidase/acylaminoacyl peptidase